MAVTYPGKLQSGRAWRNMKMLGKLRSRMKQSTPINSKSKSQLKSNKDSNEENVVVNFHKSSSLVAGFFHKCERPCPEVKIEKRKGICITAKHTVNIANFSQSPLTYSQVFQRGGVQQQAP